MELGVLEGVYIWSEFARVPKLYSPLNQDDFHTRFIYEVPAVLLPAGSLIYLSTTILFYNRHISK